MPCGAAGRDPGQNFLMRRDSTCYVAALDSRRGRTRDTPGHATQGRHAETQDTPGLGNADTIGRTCHTLGLGNADTIGYRLRFKHDWKVVGMHTWDHHVALFRKLRYICSLNPSLGKR